MVQHREWMIRSYVLTFSFVIFRWLNHLPLTIKFMDDFAERGPTVAWFSWTIPILITEAVLSWNKKKLILTTKELNQLIMKNSIKFLSLALIFVLSGCNSNEKHVQGNIAMYSKTWDDIINNGNLDAINTTNFDENVTMISSPENIVGIEAFKDYYSNFVTGFSNREFTIVDVFGQGDKLVKHWRFKGTNSGEFFGIPATGKNLDIEGTTLVVMKDGKIAQEQDFFDNAAFMQQMGITSSPNNISIIEGAYNSFAAGDVDSVLATFDPNIVWNEAENFPYADGNPYIGGEAIVKGVFAGIGEEWDNFQLVDLKFHDMSNNMVLVTGRYQGAYKKNGAPLDIQMGHLWTLKDGKIVAFNNMQTLKV